jgi:hypothetical protein
LLQAQLRFGQVAFDVAAGQGPGQGQAVALLAAQQLPQRQLQAAAFCACNIEALSLK